MRDGFASVGKGDGLGAHGASWREDKIAMLATAAITASAADPEPELPACCRDREYVEGRAREISGVGPMSPSDPSEGRPAAAAPTATDPPKQSRQGPELLVRTYVASTCSSDEFGPMVAAEAQRRNLPNAAHRASLGDGAAWIWKLQQQHFPGLVAIVAFLHIRGHVFAAAKAARARGRGTSGAVPVLDRSAPTKPERIGRRRSRSRKRTASCIRGRGVANGAH
jgi:hypothetical protein